MPKGFSMTSLSQEPLPVEFMCVQFFLMPAHTCMGICKSETVLVQKRVSQSRPWESHFRAKEVLQQAELGIFANTVIHVHPFLMPTQLHDYVCTTFWVKIGGGDSRAAEHSGVACKHSQISAGAMGASTMFC